MFFDQQDQTPGLRFLFTLAVGVILIQGLRFAEPIVVPVAMAGFLAVICLPIVLWMKSRRVPIFVAVPNHGAGSGRRIRPPDSCWEPSS